MTKNDRIAVPVILARKHWDAILSVIGPDFQRRGKEWQSWGNFVKGTIQANLEKTASPDDLAMVTLADDNWEAINGMLEAGCSALSPKWINWGNKMVGEIQAAVESARMNILPGGESPATMPTGTDPTANEIQALPETLPHSDNVSMDKAIADLREGGQREAAIQALAKIGAPVVGPLLASLKAGDKFETKLAVREVLSQMGSLAVDPLLTAFETTNLIDVNRIAAEALGKIGDARAVEPLIGHVLKVNGMTSFDAFLHERAQIAARALGKIGDERAIEPLLQVLGDRRNHELIRAAAIQALGELKADKATELLSLIFNQGEPSLGRQAGEALGRISGEHILGFLTASLKHANPDIRVNAAAGLRLAGDLRTVEALIGALKDPSWLVRNEAIRSLGIIGDKRALEPMLALLEDPIMDVRWSAVMTLGGFKDERAMPGLIQALRSREAAIRRSAAKSLGQIGDARAVEALTAALESPVETGLINSSQETAAEALGSIGDGRAIRSLMSALQHANPRVREKAARALEKINTPEALSALGKQPAG
jgi:HEAT repeat protein